ncbi:TIGR02221 family CRISPR-associated protein [Geobacillus sp. TFV-3]|uniref:TIGR02221 family CRISPR-associated protein n=1 Tax=Geobacillus sp. TFV-3 TaxID=1897059 RepID=UPI001F3A7593|nr:TIGR02221 family CRISPR-associated protein [Geobacillus sp. TFV-3]
MMIKFLSFLGKGTYRPTVYYLGEKKAAETPYIQCAVLDVLFQHGTAVDEAVIFVTKEARDKHEANLSQEFDSLQQRAPFRYRFVSIPTDLHGDQVWNVFEIVSNALEEGDEIIFDITHSFRYQPMLALLTLHYARVVKRIRVRGIYHGLFDPELKWQEWPIVDVTAFADMQDWITNVYAYIQSGNTRAMVEWIHDRDRMIRRQEQKTTSDLKAISQMAKTLQELTNSLQTNRAPFIAGKAAAALQAIEQLQTVETLRPMFRPLNELHEKMQRDIRQLAAEDDIRSGLAAIEWCISHGLTQQAYTMASELCTTAICLKNGLDPTGKKKVFISKKNNEQAEESNKTSEQAITRKMSEREIGDKILTYAVKVNSNEKDAMIDPQIYNDYLPAIKELLSYPKLLETVGNIRDYRNDINHAGWRPDPLQSEIFRKKFDEWFPTFRTSLLVYWTGDSLEEGASVAKQTIS